MNYLLPIPDTLFNFCVCHYLVFHEIKANQTFILQQVVKQASLTLF